ncbi:eukaryotic translation initiation factor 4 gamma 2 [Lucilia sericata]|uniref:eukaryotic translation initiation factor 4 gamma 2 n=1 Tax=Lucilia sericata TaxID=13632 RepID=UPI0018A856ED|nr:eukaryotic translation initiation factor 4 gamma 2 [Lucilia sericata]
MHLNICFCPCVLFKVFTIPHSTLNTHFSQSYDDPRQRWNSTNTVAPALGNNFALQDRNYKTSTIEGGSSTGDPSIGGSNLKLAITANQNDSERFNDSFNNRGGGGGQSPPTPTVGKTLLNTSANLLPITTASDTFNNLKNLLKIDKGSSPTNGGGNQSNNSSGKRINNEGGNSGYKRSPISGEGRNNLNGAGRSGASTGSGHFSTGYSKNSAKIRQHDSEVSPRPRRSFQSDSSSSRYYNKNSDILGGSQAGGIGNNTNTSNSGNPYNNSNTGGGRGGSLNANSNDNGGRSGHEGRGGYNSHNSSNNYNEGGRRNYQPHNSQSDGGYTRNISSGSGSNYRSHQGSRYENGNGNGQQRQYGSSTNAGYNNNYNNSKSYGHRSAANDGNLNGNNNSNYRSSQRERGGDRERDRDDYVSNNYRDYEDSPRGGGGGGRYNNNNGNQNSNSVQNGSSNSNTNSLERRLPPSALRQSGGERGGGYTDHRVERSSNDNSNNRALNNRSPSIRAGDNALGGGHSSSVPSSTVNSSSSSRGISPNSPALANASQHPTPAPTPPPSAGRWVPPSLRPQHGLSQAEKNDAVFRKVRGILNKLTPEKFQELSDELLKLDLNSIVILNGVILLIFDKALDEPKYSSMYAQLCKRLSEEAPSFEKDPNGSCTFLRLLIAVCRDKFNNRLKRDGAEGDSQFNKVLRPQQAAADNEADEEERRHLAKQRMLGNVKFIGELHKLDMLSKNVLHQCIMELLDKKKKRTASKEEMCEDMECLAQLLKTCGKNLDSEQGKELMNQYFETLERRSKSTDYPPRIRFMLKDVIELRENNWIPRKVVNTEGPVPIKQIRSDDEPLIRTPFTNRNRDMRNNRDDRDSDSWMNRLTINLQPGLNDMFSGLSVTGASPIISPFTTPVGNNRSYNNRDHRNNQGGNGNYNNRYNKHNNQNGPGSDRGHREDRQHQRGGDQSGSQFNSGGNQLNSKELAPRFKRNLISTNQDSVENLQMRPAANSLLFKAASQNQKLPSMLPISTPPNGSHSNLTPSTGGFGGGFNQNKDSQLSNAQYPLLGTPTSHLSSSQQNARPSSTPSAEAEHKNSHNLGNGDKSLKNTSSNPNFSSNSSINQRNTGGFEHQEDGNDKKSLLNTPQVQLVTKQGSTEKAPGANGSAKPQKKEKAFNKEEVLKKTASYIKEKFFYTETKDEINESSENDDNETTTVDKQLADVVEGFLELKVPEKCMKDVCICTVLDVLEKADEQYLDRVLKFLQILKKQVNLKPNLLLEVFKQVVKKMNEREALNPRITTFVANLLAKATVGEACLLKLNDIANYTDNGQHYPLFLLVLQQLHKTIGKDQLEEMFRASKVDLMNCLPEVDRNKTRLAEILDDRSLTFLYPLLKVQAEMSKQLTTDPDPTNFYKWIKTNVDGKYYKEEGFINALMTVVVKYVTSQTSFPEGTDVKNCPDKATIQKEESLLHKYCQILKSFLGHSIELQLIAIYALQVFCVNENFPKGMLCRWFKYLYEAEVIYEDTFIHWKEEISDKYPGKGTALFQVNNWLTWLQEAESEDDED